MNTNNKSLFKVITNDIKESYSNISIACIEEEVLSQMLNTYSNRLMSRALKQSYIKNIIKVINGCIDYLNKYPWEWTSDDFEEWCAYLYSVKNNCERTQRAKQGIISRFHTFIAESPKISELLKHYFNIKIHPICSSENLIAHKVDDENKEKRTAFTKELLNCLWNYLDNEIYKAYKNKSKSLKILQRDKVLYLIIYQYGLRANEVSMLNTTDFIRNPNRPEWGEFGGIIVKYGKSSPGSPPKRRNVWTISDNSVQNLKWYFEMVRPQYGFDNSDSLFLSERGLRLSPKSISRNLKEYLKGAGLPYENYSTHCLRHSYISHLSENINVSPRFIQEQVGHSYLATTQIYTHLSDTFVTRQLNRVINTQISKLLETRI